MYTDITSLSNEWQELLKEIEESEGILTSEQHTRLKTVTEGTDDLVNKIAGIRQYYKKQVSACNEEIERLNTRINTFQNKADNMENLLHILIVKMSNSTTKTGSLQYKNALMTITEKSSESVNIIDKELIPKEYTLSETKVVNSISLLAIKRDINLGHKVPGAEIKVKKTITIK